MAFASLGHWKSPSLQPFFLCFNGVSSSEMPARWYPDNFRNQTGGLRHVIQVDESVMVKDVQQWKDGSLAVMTRILDPS